MSYAASNLRAALDMLSIEMKSRGASQTNAIGSKADAELASFDRIVWVPQSPVFEPPHEQPNDGQAVYQESLTCDVHLHVRGDWFELERLRALFLSSLYDTFSSNAAKPVGRGKYHEPKASGAGYALTMQVVLMLPVYREEWIPGVADPVTTEGYVTDPKGENQEAVST